jgi:hypothetical protein
VTVAVFDGEFRSVNVKGTLDFASTLEVLRTAANVLDQAVS